MLSNPFKKGRKDESGLSESVKKLKTKFDQLKEKASHAVQSASKFEREAGRLTSEMESLKVLCGRIASASLAPKPPGTPFSEIEFQVFSQWGEDGILQHLIHHLKVPHQSFVEFGVETYTEASTRFLVQKDNWRGLVLDGSEENVARIRQDNLYWRHDLTAVASFITPENINQLIRDAGFAGDLGILSVDVDGMDYWIWKAIDSVNPWIVIVEYNSVFGPDAAVTIPPDASFQRSKAHFSNVFYGASLAALEHLALEKGYVLVGTNSAGNNAFFLRKDIAGPFLARTAKEAFVEAKFREARDSGGKLTFASPAERREVIAACRVHDVRTGTVRTVREVWASSQG
ncbi:MAG TPA: hypothetical protein VLE43_06365 [Candidatus Saccharimonadia bacterium]|nr:hypothetical protein [Candidatus Saccharimonadia bacterium]